MGLSHGLQRDVLPTIALLPIYIEMQSMISIQRAKFWQQAWFAALVGSVAVGGLVWWLQAHPGGEPATVVSSAASGNVGAAHVGQAGQPIPGGAAVILPDGRPSDVTPEEWQALKTAAAQEAHPEAELQRMVTYLRFQRGFAQWQALKDSPDAAVRQALARQLLNDLPQRVSNGEVSSGEAYLISAALINDLETDESARKQRMDAYKATLVEAAPKPDAAKQEQEARQLAEYKRREAAIVADWQSRPVASRDQAKLEQALEDARRAVYRTTSQ